MGAARQERMIAQTLIDGLPSKRIRVTDRGLHYGDGLFETIALRHGHPCLWSAHLARLRRGAERLRIPCPPGSLLLDECRRVGDGQDRAVVKLLLTRGSGGRGYRPPAVPKPVRILQRYPWPEYPADWSRKGVLVGFCETRLASQPGLAGLKHLNRLEQVLARSEWDDPEQAEGLMLDGQGRVIGGTMTNLFAFARGRLLTPPLDACGIAGTARELVLARGKEFGLEVVEVPLEPVEVLAADGLFLTNALIGAWPVRRLGTRQYPVQDLPLAFLAWLRMAVHQPEGEGA
jgi:4-amino-4-deoxychorismate lyase